MCVLGVQTATRQELLDYFDNTWTLTEVLFSGLLVCGNPPALESFVSMRSHARVSGCWPRTHHRDACMLTFLRFGRMQGREVFKRSPWHQLRHPLIFYYGHVAALYINKFRVAGLIQDPVDEELEQIMETGVDEMRWDDLAKNHKQWPSVSRVHAYRNKVCG